MNYIFFNLSLYPKEIKSSREKDQKLGIFCVGCTLCSI